MMALLPPVSELPAAPRRLILHWSGGGREASAHDRDRYHVLVEQWGGKYRYADGVPISRNMRSVSGLPAYHNDPERGYAAHTRGFNSHSIGFALCGMRDAVDMRPDGDVEPGPEPISEVQVEGLVKLVAHACELYGLQAKPEHVFTHWEADHVHGVPQAGKWDITWLPGWRGSRQNYGSELRRRVRVQLQRTGP